MKDMLSKRTIVYFPDKSIKQGYLSLFREMVGEVIDSRWLTSQFFRRNFVATYRQSLLGIFWALIVPLVSVGTFIFLNSGGVFNVGEISVPYPLFALAGTAIWQIFSIGLTLSASSLVNAGAMIGRIYFPRESLVISGAAQGFIPSLIQIVIVLILFASYQIMPPPTVFLAIFAVIPLIILTLGLGFIIALLNSIIRDIGNSIGVLITFLMFFTPILYAKPAGGIVATVSQYNPLYYLVAVPRDLIIYGNASGLHGYFYSTLFSIVVFILCWMAFHIAETRISERI